MGEGRRGFSVKLLNKIKRAIRAFRESTGMVDIDDHLFRSILSSSDKDLSPYEQSRAQKICYFLYERNPMAKRLINMTAEYLTSDGIEIKSKDKAVLEILDSFLKRNNLDILCYDMVKELGLWGEQCYQMLVNKHNGACTLTYIDPTRIKSVVLSPKNCLITEKIIIENDIELEAVQVLPLSEDNSFYKGDTFYYKINSVLAASRGRSDILAAADYCDLASQFVFSRGERSIFGNVWMWDVLVDGATPEECEAFAKKHPVPKSGSMRVHNEKVKWSAVNPDLRAHDASHDGRLLKTFVLGSMGYPEHFFGEGGDVNKATAVEMYEPVTKMLASRQKLMTKIFQNLCDYQLDKAMAAGILSKGSHEYEVFFPEISGKNMERAGLTMLYLAQSLSIAMKANWLTPADAAKVYAQIASTFGPNVQPVEDPKPMEDLRPDITKKPRFYKGELKDD